MGLLAPALLLTHLARVANAACVTTIQPVDNVQADIDACPAGTAFTVMAGMYRMQSVSPKNGDTITGVPGALFNGSQLVTSFSRSGSLWTATGLPVVYDDTRTGICDPNHPACGHPQDVYFDDSPLIDTVSVAGVTSGKYYFDYSHGTVYIADNPTGHKSKWRDVLCLLRKWDRGHPPEPYHREIREYRPDRCCRRQPVGRVQPVNWTIQIAKSV